MNILFFTQTKSLDLFYQLYLRVKNKLNIEKMGFYVAGLEFYEEFLKDHPDFEEQFTIQKEWEIYREADGHTPDLERITLFEDEIGDPTLWSPLVTDRRLLMGKRTRFRQDYRSRFSYTEKLAIMEIALQKIDKMFSEVKPDLVCTVYTATFGDCLAHMFAKARGIRSLDLRLARLKNCVMFVDGVVEPAPHIVDIFEGFKNGVPDDLKKEAEDYIATVVKDNAMYEGVVPSLEKRRENHSDTRDKKSSVSLRIVLRAVGLIRRYYKFTKIPYRYDYQHAGVIRPLVYNKLLNPFNLKRIRRELRDSFVDKNALRDENYILYPLHTEPELVLSQFARPYLNQIEVIRNISLSMPIGMTLLVKEHPMMLGRRSRGYYNALLRIPNVRLVDFDLSSDVALEHARLVVIIRGAIGLEAVIRRKPVVSLGKSLFDILPICMFRSCWSLYDLPHAIHDMLSNYHYDHDALVGYLAAVMKGSSPVNLVSDLLEKPGRFRMNLEHDGSLYQRHPHLDRLANYLIDRIMSEKNPDR